MNKLSGKSYQTYGLYLLVSCVVAGVVYGFYALYTEKTRLEAELADTRGRLDLVEKKYAKEKTLTQGLLRTKQSLEGMLRGMEAKVKQAEADVEKIRAEKDGLEAEYAKKTDVLNVKIQTLTERIDKLKETRDEIIARYKEKVETVRKHEQTIAELTNTLGQTEYELKRTRKKLDVCGEHNERLCTINEELVDMYKNKGLVNVLSVTEPLTQLRKVEMEKMVQMYKEKIEANKESTETLQ